MSTFDDLKDAAKKLEIALNNSEKLGSIIDYQIYILDNLALRKEIFIDGNLDICRMERTGIQAIILHTDRGNSYIWKRCNESEESIADWFAGIESRSKAICRLYRATGTLWATKTFQDGTPGWDCIRVYNATDGERKGSWRE